MAPETPDALARLHDVVTPAPVSWAPQTVGWAVLAVALAALIGWLGWRALRRARANRYRRVALAELHRVAEALRADPSGGLAALGTVNEILKRTALMAWPRSEVASLAGEDWLAFLDAAADGQGFRSGPGRVLADRVYAPGGIPATEEERRAFFATVRRWIQHHRSEDTPDASGPGQAGRPDREETAA